MSGSARNEPHPAVLSVAFPYAPVGPGAVGGAEVILSLIEAALPSLGFSSVVVGHAQSAPRGKLYPTPVPAAHITDEVREEVEAAQQANIDYALAENPVALVHMHGLDFHRYRIPEGIPVLVTLHLPPAWYPPTIWAAPANYHFVCVSESQRAACPASIRDRLTVVGNGVPLPDIRTLRPEGRYAVMLARICPEKNLSMGLDAARLAGVPAMLGGEVFGYEAHQRYFTDEILPRLTASGDAHQHHGTSSPQPQARFLGPVTGDAKGRLLARAACLLLPSLAPETSSLVAMEALAAGVPVIAMASGAVPEIVDDGVTGFLIRGEQDTATGRMAEAILRLPSLDRRACRAAAEARFALPRMLEAYGSLYHDLASAPPPASAAAEEIPTAAAVDSAFLSIPPAQLSVEHIGSTTALEALEPGWEQLWHADGGATPFQHPAWLLPWWHQFGPDGHLHTLALQDGAGCLRGLLPVYAYQPPDGTDRQLLFVGAGTTDLCDGLFDASGDPDTMAGMALQYAAGELEDWTSLSLGQLRPASALVRAGQPLGLSVCESEPCSTLSTLTPLPAKIHLNAGRYRRRAERQGTLLCTVAQTAAESLDAFEHLVRLHGERWRSRAEPGVLEDVRVLAHHREAIPRLAKAGLLRMFSLTLGEKTLAVLYALADAPSRSRRALYLYLIGIDPRFAEVSPGTLLLHAVWEQARAAGFDSLNLLRGAESYKELWGAAKQQTVALHSSRSAPLEPHLR